ncbi:metallophosphoesterase [Serinibacter salmoneus]|uniref:Calcineurin-like phosphoesterase family protein n=1 Tax=Serinibacter salmoneus TaxID=556530 RepID=A0A2A9CZY8_9MICO|nr:metallophosphoesterase [Serinibacter salmoneus]PFG19701.1 calcineurin-like phosphoesterase family protein [Serinibacter salmoneus]
MAKDPLMTLPQRRLTTRTAIALLAAAPVSALLVVGTPLTTASADTAACSALEDPIHERVKSSTDQTLLTQWGGEADGAMTHYGFDDSWGSPFEASIHEREGLVELVRLWHPRTGNFVWIQAGGEVDTAVAKYGYIRSGSPFYAAANGGEGCIEVHRLLKGTMHAFAAGDFERARLESEGWTYEKVAFYAAPGEDFVADGAAAAPSPQPVPVPTPEPEPEPEPDADSTFTVAVIPDTQTWVGTRDPRWSGLTSWLAENADDLDLEFVMHSGDVVNWGWLDQSQYDVASEATDILAEADIPFVLSIGNHDTRAVGVGGSAYINSGECEARLGADACHTSKLLRATQEFNENFTAEDFGGVDGAFEAGKVDNVYSTFSAGGKDWMVLSLEYNPRAEAVAWAQDVVESHPEHNVLLSTHYYLSWDGSIHGGAVGNNATNGRYVYDQLVSKYPNISMVFSGHIGSSATRTDTGAQGNTVAAILNNDVTGNKANGVTLVTIDAATGETTTRIYAPSNDTHYSQYDYDVTLDLVG